MKTKKTYVVLGVPRGGTSMVAGLLRILGIDMGRNIKADKHEDRDLFMNPANKIIPRISYRNNIKEIWGWKDPWIGRTIKDIHKILINPQFIVITRSPEDSVVSDLNRNKNAVRNKVEGRNNILQNNISNFIEENPSYNYLHLEYDEVMNNKRDSIYKMAEFLEVNLTPELLAECEEFIAPEYRTIRGENE